MFEDVDTEIPGGPPPEESDNRTFMIAAGVLGGITIISLICMAIYALVIVPRSRSQQIAQATGIALTNTQVALANNQTMTASVPTRTATPTVTNTPSPSPTQVIVQATATPTEEEDGTPGPRTATVAALLTQAAQQTLTVVPTATALPDTGFADEIGVPSLIALAFVFIAVIFLVRRMRVVTS